MTNPQTVSKAVEILFSSGYDLFKSMRFAKFPLVQLIQLSIANPGDTLPASIEIETENSKEEYKVNQSGQVQLSRPIAPLISSINGADAVYHFFYTDKKSRLIRIEKQASIPAAPQYYCKKIIPKYFLPA